MTPEVQKKITDAIETGNYSKAAAAYAGITEQTYYAWLKRGEAEIERLQQPYTRPRKREAPYVEFLNAVREAEAIAEITVVARWKEQIPESWQAARDFLARRYPDRWGPKHRQEITGKDGSEIVFKVGGIDLNKDI